MATGDKIIAGRVRADSNERLDLIDFLSQSQTAQFVLECAQRALLSSPKATVGASTGERWTGSLTANPTSGADGLFRLDSAVFVGLDANGGLVLSPAGTAISVAIPAGGSNQQVYAYMSDVAINTQIRRFIPATSPFTEFPQAINVALQQTCNLFVRAGSVGSVVAEDVVAGATRPLLFLGICTNIGGAVTFLPASNTLETVRAPLLVPTSDTGITTGGTTTTGGQSTLRELVNAALYAIGNIMFKSSAQLTPSDANNWGAYNVPLLSGGLDKTARQILGYATIGDGVTVFGDFNTNTFANSKLLMDAAFASLPTTGGTIVIKRGVQLVGWGGITCTSPAAKHVEIIGDHSVVPAGSPQLSFGSGESITQGAGASLTFRNVHIRWVGQAINIGTSPTKFIDCFFEKLVSADTGAAISGAAAVSDVYIERCTVSITLNAGSANGMFFRAGGSLRRLTVRKLIVVIGGLECSIFGFSDMRSDIDIQNVNVSDTGGTSGVTAGCGVFVCNSFDNTGNGKYFNNIVSTTANVPTFFLGSAGNITISAVEHTSALIAISATSYLGTGALTIRDSTFSTVQLVGSIPDLILSNCLFTLPGSKFGSTGQAQGRLAIQRCRFIPTADGGNVVKITGTTITSVKVDDCYFEGLSSIGSAFGAVIVQATILRTFLAQRCQFFNFQNINYAGANSYLRMFQIDVTQIAVCVVQECVCSRVMNDFSGSASSGAYLLELNSADRSTANASFDQVIVRDNVIGDQEPSGSFNNSVAMLVRLSNFLNVEQLHVLRNKLWLTYENGTVGKASLDHLVNIQTAVAANGRELRFDDNSIKFRQGGGNLSAIAVDVLRATKTGGTGFWYGWRVNDNDILVESSTPAFDGVNGFGFNVPGWTINNLTFLGNSAAYSSTGTNYLKFRATGAVTNFNATGGSIPGSGVAMPGIQIARF